MTAVPMSEEPDVYGPPKPSAVAQIISVNGIREDIGHLAREP